MFKKLLSLFFIYSFVGWILEIFYVLITDKKLVNRGFLVGPCCPIYGVGCVLITVVLNNSVDDMAGLFLKSALLCAVLEYLTSYLMEKIYKYRWWDYSNKKFNINGRVCLETMVPFALLSCFIIKVLNPWIFSKIGIFSSKILTIILIILSVIFVSDIVISNILVSKITNIKSNGDSTKEIKSQMLNMLGNKRTIYKRIFESFPDIKK